MWLGIMHNDDDNVRAFLSLLETTMKRLKCWWFERKLLFRPLIFYAEKFQIPI